MRYLALVLALVGACKKDDGKRPPADDKTNEPAAGPTAGEAPSREHHRGRKTEAALMLHRLEKLLKMTFIEKAEFPKGQAGPTPAAACCAGPNAHCAVMPAAEWTKDPVWAALDFHIDEPNLFQYGYSSDGKTVRVTAIGDLDCDTTMITYVLEGKADQGNPTFTLTEPPPEAD